MAAHSVELQTTLPAGVLEAAARRWRLLPIESRGKTPLVKGWQNAATDELEVLESWAREHPNCNWGVATGASSDLLVIDIDGIEGRSSLNDLERQGLTLPPTLAVTTGRLDGGEHRYYLMPANIHIRNDQSGKIGPRIDVRGTGGFAVCPPSIHASGTPYRFIDPSAPIADLPSWVVGRLTERPSAPAAMAQQSRPKVVKGGRTNLLVSLAGTMNKRGMSVGAIEAALIAENRARFDPPLPEDKVRGIAPDIVKRYPADDSDVGVVQAVPLSGFRLVPIGELLSRPEVPPDYLVDGLLVRGTLSCVVAKPKVGKSTLARALCLAVAKGTEFLGRDTRHGSCIYLALEERAEEVTADFRAMGANGTELISVHADAVPEAAILSLVSLVYEQRPALVVIDPLFRMVRVRDEKGYAEVYGALSPLIDTARSTGTHILVAHHSSKALKGDAIDTPLGSTAIGGAVSTLIVLKRTESYRSIQTVQRTGIDMPETVLSFDPDTRCLSACGTRAEADCHKVEEEIVEYLRSGEEKIEPEIIDHVEGANAIKRRALRTLVERRRVRRDGAGKKGAPFRYSFVCTKSMEHTSVQEKETDLITP